MESWSVSACPVGTNKMKYHVIKKIDGELKYDENGHESFLSGEIASAFEPKSHSGCITIIIGSDI